MQGKNVEDKNGGVACQGSGEDWKGENGRGMESVCRRMLLHKWRNRSKTHPTRNSVCTCLDLIFLGTQSVSGSSQGLFFFYSASGTGLVRNQKLYVADEKHEH